MQREVLCVLFVATIVQAFAFQNFNNPSLKSITYSRPLIKNACKSSRYISSIKMVADLDLGSLHHIIHDSANIMAIVKQGIADGADAVSDTAQFVCPKFGEPGWGPFCFLNGNPVFKAFDSFQELIQNSVVTLHDLLAGVGVKEAWGPSIILFTVFIRTILFPVNLQQVASTQKIQALNPKVQEIKEKFPNNLDIQNQLVGLLYQETKANPLAGCLPALLQIPVFLALYRSFQNLASESKLTEPFLWLPDLQGPVYGSKDTEWLFGAWHDYTPKLGWHDTLAFLSVPFLLYVAQTVSLQILTPPSDDPAVQRSQQILKYLPLLLAYFSLSVPSGLGVYWITNNILSTVSTAGIKAYFKSNPVKVDSEKVDKIISEQLESLDTNKIWGYMSEEDMTIEATVHAFPSRSPIIPDDFE